MKRTVDDWNEFYGRVAITTFYKDGAELIANLAEAVRKDALTEAARAISRLASVVHDDGVFPLTEARLLIERLRDEGVT